MILVIMHISMKKFALTKFGGTANFFDENVSGNGGCYANSQEHLRHFGIYIDALASILRTFRWFEMFTTPTMHL